MLRFLGAVLTGAVVLAVWSAAYWMTVGRGAFGVIAGEAPVTDAIRAQVREPGAYYFPGLPPGEISQEQQRDFLERHRRGPVGMLFVHESGGGETMEAMTLVKGFAINLLTSALITAVVGMTAGSRRLAGRWSVAVLMGLAAAVGTHGLQWNSLHLPAGYSAYLVADVAGSWALAGLVIAAILARRRPAMDGIAR